MRELFITDLDGTLLDGDARLPVRSRDILNGLIGRGLCFTAATARTIASVGRILEGLELRLPVILMNGVLAWDPGKREYVLVNRLEDELCREVAGRIKERGLGCFMYSLEGNVMTTSYQELINDPMREFCEIRRKRYDKPFIKVRDMAESAPGSVYFTLLDTRERLLPLYEELRADGRLGLTWYEDIYDRGLWYLEIFSAKASKENALRWLRKEYGFERVTAFGDNLNDIPLMRAADVRAAVENAVPELKEICHITVGPNTRDGVAEYIKEVWHG